MEQHADVRPHRGRVLDGPDRPVGTVQSERLGDADVEVLLVDVGAVRQAVDLCVLDRGTQRDGHAAAGVAIRADLESADRQDVRRCRVVLRAEVDLLRLRRVTGLGAVLTGGAGGTGGTSGTGGAGGASRTGRTGGAGVARVALV